MPPPLRPCRYGLRFNPVTFMRKAFTPSGQPALHPAAEPRSTMGIWGSSWQQAHLSSLQFILLQPGQAAGVESRCGCSLMPCFPRAPTPLCLCNHTPIPIPATRRQPAHAAVLAAAGAVCSGSASHRALCRAPAGHGAAGGVRPGGAARPPLLLWQAAAWHLYRRCFLLRQFRLLPRPQFLHSTCLPLWRRPWQPAGSGRWATTK